MQEEDGGFLLLSYYLKSGGTSKELMIYVAHMRERSTLLT